jgi:hypothetical protein
MKSVSIVEPFHPINDIDPGMVPARFVAAPAERAREVVEAGWAVWHPWAKKREGWEGFVMLYTPQSMEELEVTFQLIVDGYNYVTGKSVLATDYGR